MAKLLRQHVVAVASAVDVALLGFACRRLCSCALGLQLTLKLKLELKLELVRDLEVELGAESRTASQFVGAVS